MDNININGLSISCGDIIKFNISDENNKVNRTISTYHYKPIGCYSDTEYIVTHFGDKIPQQKGIIKEKTNDQYIFVKPKNLLNDEKIFWFINISKMKICQYEDGCEIYNINYLSIQ